jgi:predicted Fe-Mo cluster-binding NifX family protein
MMSSANADGAMSLHFGQAEWIMIAGSDPAEEVRFVENDERNGRRAAAIVLGEGCGDAVFVEIGPGAAAHLQSRSVRGWQVSPGLTGAQALERFRQGGLKPADVAGTHEGGGCCGLRR